MHDDIKEAFLLRLPKKLLNRIKRRSAALNRSVNSYCIDQLYTGLAAQPALGTVAAAPIRNALIMQPGNSALAALYAETCTYVTSVLARQFDEQLLGVVLYGSAARDQLATSSDIDLLVVLKREFVFDRDIYDKIPNTRIQAHPVSVLFSNLPAPGDMLRSLWMEIALDGIVLLDSNFAVSQYLIQVRRNILAGTSSREKVYGVSYWSSRAQNPDVA